MMRTNIYPVQAVSVATAHMLAGEPIRIDGMQLEFDDKVALYPAKLNIEESDGQPRRQRDSND